MSIIDTMRATRNAEDIQDFDLPTVKPNQQLSKSLELPIENISPYIDEFGEAQPFDIDEEDLNRLVMSIAANGQLEPIKVKQIGSSNQYVVLSGHRRLEAMKKLRKRTIKADVVDIPQDKEFEYVCHSNIYRLNKSPSSLAKILCGFKTRGKKVSDIAEMFGINRRTCTRYLCMIDCIEELQHLCDSKVITVEAFTSLQNLTKEQQRVFANFIINVGKRVKFNVNLKKANMAEDLADSCEESGEEFNEEALLNLFFATKDDTEPDKAKNNDTDNLENILYVEQLLDIIRDRNVNLQNVSNEDIIKMIIEASERFGE